MTARYLLDTNVLSLPIQPAPDARVLRRLEARAHACVTAAPVLHELRYGSRLLEPSRRRAVIERFVEEVLLRVYPVLPYDRAAAEWHADERARLSKAGSPAPYADAVIAAIAAVNSLVLVTANTRDFRRFRDLEVETWA